MTLPVIRVGDPITHGGSVVSGSPSTKVMGQFQARETDPVTCDIHGSTTISPTTSIVVDNGLHVARDGDLTECGATLIATETVVLAD